MKQGRPHTPRGTAQPPCPHCGLTRPVSPEVGTTEMDPVIKDAWKKAERTVIGHALGCIDAMQALAEQSAITFAALKEGDS
jgi:hypothetical protein